MILVNLFQQDTSEISLSWQQDMTTTWGCSAHITTQRTSTIHSGALIVDPLSQKKSRYDKLYHIRYFIIITRVLRKDHIKKLQFNWWFWWLWQWRQWCCLWRWKRPGCHHKCRIGGEKYTIHKRKTARPFITFAKNPSWLFEGTMQKPNNPDKGRKIMHHHRVCCSDHEHVP